VQLPRYHRLRQSLYRLEGSHCSECGMKYFPRRKLCPACRAQDLEPYRFSGRGTIYSFTDVHQPPRGFGSLGSYPVGMVRLEEGPLVTCQLTDIDGVELAIGMDVEMVTRKIQDVAEHGYIVYGYKFRPQMRRNDP
jgi:uncharacterized OB-fold protein